MRESYWRTYLKHRGGLITTTFAAAMFVIVFVWPAVLEQQEIRNEAVSHAEYYSAEASEKVRSKCARLAGQARVDCAQPIEDLARENERREHDLAAQRVTALWTGIMGAVAVLGVALSGVGVFLVWTTFAETKNANLIARRLAQPVLDVEIHMGPMVNIGEYIGMGATVSNKGASAARNVKIFGVIGINSEPNFSDAQLIVSVSLLREAATQQVHSNQVASGEIHALATQMYALPDFLFRFWIRTIFEDMFRETIVEDHKFLFTGSTGQVSRE